LTHHRDSLFQLTKSNSLCDAIVNDYRGADIGEKDVAMMAFSDRLTRDPGAIEKKDVAELRGVGFKDAEIHDIVQVTAYFNFVNRMASGLGVELEPRFSP
jgi:uncharacterized peroxidase-related enzyme